MGRKLADHMIDWPAGNRDARLPLLVVGAEARAAWQRVAIWLPECDGRCVPDLQAALGVISSRGQAPAAIVLGRSWPGDVDAAALASLRRAAPLARVCELLGSWCEGEARSGKPMRGTLRIYGHQWPQRLARQLRQLLTSADAVWSLPVTATAEEQLMVDLDPPPGRQGTIVVVAQNVETLAVLADCCRAAGYTTSELRQPGAARCHGAQAIVWDTIAEHAGDAELVSRLRDDCGGAPLLVCLGFPRPDEVALAQAAGVSAVLSKPYLVADLHWQLAALCKSSLAS